MQEIQKLFSSIPGALDGDDNDALADDRKKKAIANVRTSIANRWNHLMSFKGKIPDAHYMTLVDRMKEGILMLTEIHGTDLPFCPDPDDKCINPVLQQQGKQTEIGALGDGSVSGAGGESSTGGSGSSAAIVPHSFKFLNAQNNAVWTCVQVGSCLGVEYDYMLIGWMLAPKAFEQW